MRAVARVGQERLRRARGCPAPLPDRAAPSDGGSTCDAASCVAPNAATFVSQSIPSSVAPGSTFSVQVTMKNTGTATWTMKGTGKNDGYSKKCLNSFTVLRFHKCV